MIKTNNLETCMKTLLTSRNMLQSELAEKIGFSVSYINLLICGKRQFYRIYFERICKALELDDEEHKELSKYVVTKYQRKLKLQDKIELYKKSMLSLVNEANIAENNLQKHGGIENIGIDALKEIYNTFSKRVAITLVKISSEVERLDDTRNN